MSWLDRVSGELAKQPRMWWGHAEEHGWVVLDRDDVRNDGESRHLVRYHDWAPVEVSRTDFGSNRFRGFESHIRAVAKHLRREACEQLLAFCREFASRAPSFRVTKADLERRHREAEREAVIEAHRQYLNTHGFPESSVRIPAGRSHRITRCWRCKKHLDNAVDVECSACGWIVCRCGGCGCGYQGLNPVFENR